MKQVNDMDMDFSDVKIHNEIEFCTVWDNDVKMTIERAFLQNRISYYEKWDDASFFSRLFGKSESRCTICINRMQIEKAEEILKDLPLDPKNYEMVLKRIDKTFF